MDMKHTNDLDQETADLLNELVSRLQARLGLQEHIGEGLDAAVKLVGAEYLRPVLRQNDNAPVQLTLRYDGKRTFGPVALRADRDEDR